jgi:hypothetical protein
MPSLKYKHLSLFAGQEQIGNDRMMIRIGVDDSFALQYFKIR